MQNRSHVIHGTIARRIAPLAIVAAFGLAAAACGSSSGGVSPGGQPNAPTTSPTTTAPHTGGSGGAGF